ncbi:hypothetical protein HHK36_010399 [Tetracentron sinense]|uniref:Uncharacterized protein n=1 Tax=Tetracentron sinense TaxID=13715 RepID=A0A834ZEU1_TETSI|nr:hypothetical protein HHK36_010399 [Tetracentron sinense]
MDPSKKRKTDENGTVSMDAVSGPKPTPKDKHNIIEPFTEEQLLTILQVATARHLDVLDAVRSISDHDPAKRKLFVRGLGVDVVISVIFELTILASLVFSAVSLYLRHMQLAFILICITMLLCVCMKITKQVRLARKKRRRMLLPLSM